MILKSSILIKWKALRVCGSEHGLEGGFRLIAPVSVKFSWPLYPLEELNIFLKKKPLKKFTSHTITDPETLRKPLLKFGLKVCPG